MEGQIKVHKWDDFQHYKNRRPPWIKLYRDLLDDRQYRALDDFSARLLVDIWLLTADASNTLAGCMPYDTFEIAWRLRISDESRVEKGLRRLVSAGFITLSGDNASATLAKCKQLAIPERETETERETEKDLSKTKFSDDRFDTWWKLYPRKIAKGAARKAYKGALKRATESELLEGVQRFAEKTNGKEPEFIAHASTWLNADRWLDEDEPRSGLDAAFEQARKEMANERP